MTAQPLQVSEFRQLHAFDADVRRCISALYDAKARQRIVDHYLTGWCTAEFALETLISLDLVEFSPEALSDE